MGKKKQKQKSQIKVENAKADTLMSIDDERITKIITNALTEYDRQKQEAAKVEKEKEKDNSSVFQILFKPKKYAKGLLVNARMMQTALKVLYKIIELSLYVISAMMFFCVFLNRIIPNMPSISIFIEIVFMILALPIFLIARIFRIAAIEVDEIRDNNYLFGLFAAMASIISIIVAIVALAK